MRDTIHRAGGDAPVPVVRLAGPLDRDAADRLAPDLLGCESGLVVVDGREVPQASAAGQAALAALADRVRAGPEAEHGRGLHLRAALARAWGSAALRDDGTLVWASIPVPG